MFDQGNYDLAKKMLDATILRHEALASNMANSQTPGYKRIDLDPTFETQLQTLANQGDTEGVKALTPTLQQDMSAHAISPDGNNVQIDTEMIEMNKNTLNYDYLTQFISNNIKHINAAITGEINH